MQRATSKLDPVWVKRSLIGGGLALLGTILAWAVIGNLIR